MDLLKKEVLRISLRLLLLNGFQTSYPETTQAVQGLFRRCPLLFQSVLTKHELEGRSKTGVVGGGVGGGLADGGSDSRSCTLSDGHHLSAKSTGRIAVKDIKANLGFPTRTTGMPEAFERNLQGAYARPGRGLSWLGHR